MNSSLPAFWASILFLAALAFFALELFIPSSGVLGLMAISSIVGSVWMIFSGYGLTSGTIYVLALAAVIPLLVTTALRWWPYTPLGRRFLNLPPLEERDEPVVESYEQMRGLIGHRGVTRSMMLPGGVVEIDGVSHDAVAEDGALEKGEIVEVVRTEGLHMVVRRVTLTAPPGQNDISMSLEDPFAT